LDSVFFDIQLLDYASASSLLPIDFVPPFIASSCSQVSLSFFPFFSLLLFLSLFHNTHIPKN